MYSGYDVHSYHYAVTIDISADIMLSLIISGSCSVFKCVFFFIWQVASAAPSSSDEEFELLIYADDSKDPSELLKCLVDAVAKALEDTNYDKVIERLKEDMVVVDLKLRTCEAEEEKRERRK